MIYLFLADGFEEVEAITPLDILRRGGIDVKTVGVTGKTVTGAHGVAVTCDTEIENLKSDGLEAVILPGGMPGTLNLQNSKDVINAVNYTNENGLLVAAICAAPSVLGQMGILKGKTAVCYPGFEDKLTGAQIFGGLSVKDGNIITAKGPGAAAEFGFSILAALKGQKAADEVKKGMIF